MSVSDVLDPPPRKGLGGGADYAFQPLGGSEGFSDTLKLHRCELQDYLDCWFLRHDEILASTLPLCEANTSRSFRPSSGSSVGSKIRTSQPPTNPWEAFTSPQTSPPSWLVSQEGFSRAVKMLGVSEETGPSRPAQVAAENFRKMTQGFGRVDTGTNWRVIAVLARVERSMVFELLCALVIIANASTLALCTEGQVERRSDSCGPDLERAELVFFAFYCAELCLRIAMQRMDFLFSSEWKWNCFDSLLVASAIHEQVITYMMNGSTDSGQNLSYLRLARVIKMVKLLRIMRIVRAFRELRLVMNSVLGSMQSMIWSVLFVVTIMFMFGTCFVQATAQYLIESSDDDSEAVSALRTKAILYWGSIRTSMGSLWMATTGGQDWEAMALPLHEMGGMYYVLFIAYVGFFLFVVTNVLTSLFIDAAVQYAERDHRQVIQAQLSQKKEYSQQIVKLYKQMDKDNDGQISQEEFNHNINDHQLTAFASSLDIDTVDLQQFFGILSSGGRRKVDLDTFVIGCIKLRGSAKAMDLIELMLHQKHDTDMQTEFRHHCKHEFEALNQRLCSVADSLAYVRSAVSSFRSEMASTRRTAKQQAEDRENIVKESL